MQLAPPLPWDVGDVLHVLRKHWRDVFATACGGQATFDHLARIQDLLRSLRRAQNITVRDTAEGFVALRGLASGSGVLWECKTALDSAEDFLIDEARRQFLGEQQSAGERGSEAPEDGDPRFP